MRFGVLGGVFLVVVAILVATPPAARGQVLGTYDDFSGSAVDGRRWYGVAEAIRYANLVSFAGGWMNQVEGQWTRDPRYSVANVAVRRGIVNGQLQLQLTTAGGTHPNPDVAPGNGRAGLRMRVKEPRTYFDELPPPVTRIQSQVTVIAAEAQPCRSTGESRTRAQVFVHLFNWGNGDVFASLSLQRKSFEPDRIVAVLSHCRSSACTIADDLGSVVFNRSWRVGAIHSLTITHQAADSRVSFQVAGGGVASETRYVSYPEPPSGPPRARHYELRLENTPANCPAQGGVLSERVAVTMDARFDNVRINESALPAR